MPKKIDRGFLIICTIITTAVLLRLIKLFELFHFTYDEEVFAFVGKRMFVNGHIPLIGGVTPMHVHLAPYFYWLSGVVLFLSHLNPLGWGVAASVVAALAMWMLYVTSRDFFGRKVAVVAVVIYGFSFFQNLFDRHYWGLAFDGLIALVVVFALGKIISGSPRFSYLLAIVLSFGFHTDPSTLVLFLLSGIVWVVYKPKVPKAVLYKSIFIFAFSFLPLLLFDVRHNFVNVLRVTQYVAEVKAGREGVLKESPTDVLLFVPRALGKTMYVFGNQDLATQYSYCPQYVTGRLTQVPVVVWLATGVIVLLVFFGIKSRNDKERLLINIIAILFASIYIGIALYGIIFKGDLFDHYLATIFPLFYLVLAVFLVRMVKNKWVIGPLLGLFVWSNLVSLQNAHHRFGLADKTAAVNWAIAATGNEPFSLDVIGDCFRYNGYRYLFYVYGKEPAKSYVDENFSYLYDISPAVDHPRLLVVFTNPDYTESQKYAAEYEHYQKQILKKAQFGAIEVLLIDNSNLEYAGKF